MTDRPLADAAKRLRKRHKNNPLSEQEVGVALGMAAVGVPQTKIADVLGVNRNAVKNQLLSIPDYRQRILRMREILKLRKMRNALRIEEKLWQLAERKIEASDAKEVDATLRALHASEKIQQAVAGEGQRLEVHSNAPPPVDLKILIQQILGE